jgi:hypothetical protein
MVEKEIEEIWRIRRLKKHNEDGVKSRKAEDGIGSVGRGRGRRMTGSRNVEANGENLRSLDIAGGTSVKGVGM